MRKKIKILLFLFIGLIILSCNYDDETNISYASSQTNNHFILKKVYLKEYSKNTKLFNQINKVKSKKLKLVDATGKIVNSSEGSFNINTDFATYIENNGKHSYTFKIDRENPQYLLENLVLNSNDSLGYDAYIVQYDINESEYNQLLRAENINLSNKVTLTNLIDENLISTIFNKEAVVDIQTLCLTTTVISGNSCPGEEHHTLADILAGQYCPYLANGSITLYASQTIYSWEECTVSIGIGGGGGGTGGTSGGGSGSGNTTGNNYDGSDPNIHGNSSISTALTLEENNNTVNISSECDKIKKQFIDNPTLLDKLLTLDGLTTESTEKGIHKLSNSNIIQSASVASDGSIQMPVIPNSVQCTMMAHTHNSPANSTYSIFSWSDLSSIGEALNNGKIDATKFVMFLSTADGTRYAYTINDAEKLKKFFAITLNPNFDMNIAEKRLKERKKYYYPDVEGVQKIKENSLDNLADEKAFLDLLQDNDIGITLFEVDPTYTIFEKVTNNKTTGNIDKTNCN